jgi:hypothetical protein
VSPETTWFPFCRLLRLAGITVEVFLPASTRGSRNNLKPFPAEGVSLHTKATPEAWWWVSGYPPRRSSSQKLAWDLWWTKYHYRETFYDCFSFHPPVIGISILHYHDHNDHHQHRHCVKLRHDHWSTSIANFIGLRVINVSSSLHLSCL